MLSLSNKSRNEVVNVEEVWVSMIVVIRSILDDTVQPHSLEGVQQTCLILWAL